MAAVLHDVVEDTSLLKIYRRKALTTESKNMTITTADTNHWTPYLEPIPKERFLTGATKSRCSVFVEKWQIFAIFSVKASFSPHLV